MREKSKGALGNVAGEIERLAETRTSLAKEVSARANEVMPNTSALIGGLVAARSCRMPGGFFSSPGYRQARSRCLVPDVTVRAPENTVPLSQARDHLSTPSGAQRPP